jgi:single-strand DNA-binding protein
MSYCKVVILGNLTRDPELRYTTKGAAVLDVSIAVNRKWKSESGESKEEVSFIDSTAFGKSAETIAKYCRKGSQLLVDGRLKTESWDDKTTGRKRSKLKVVIESFQFVGSPRDSASQPAPAAPRQNTSTPLPKAELPPGVEDNELHDVPF